MPDMPQRKDAPPAAALEIPDLLGWFSEDEQAVIAALAAAAAPAPRTLDEAAADLGIEPRVAAWHLATACRHLVRGHVQPHPAALRLVGSTLAERVSQDIEREGIYSLHALVPAILVYRFPATLTRTVVNLWTGGHPEATYWGGVQILDPEGQEVIRGETAFPGAGVGAYHVQTLSLTWYAARPGLYRVAVWMGTAPRSAYPLPILAVQEATDGPA